MVVYEKYLGSLKYINIRVLFWFFWNEFGVKVLVFIKFSVVELRIISLNNYLYYNFFVLLNVYYVVEFLVNKI